MFSRIHATFLLSAGLLFAGCERYEYPITCDINTLKQEENYVQIKFDDSVEDRINLNKVYVLKLPKLRSSNKVLDSVYLDAHILINENRLRFSEEFPFRNNFDFENFRYHISSVGTEYTYFSLSGIHVQVVPNTNCPCCYDVDRSMIFNSRYYAISQAHEFEYTLQ